LAQLWSGENAALRHGNAGQPADLYFWRDSTGHEVDVVFESAGKLQAIEIKSGATFVGEWLNAARKWTQFAGDEALPPWIVYGGDSSYTRERMRVVSWREC
jgi:predicted AAA+ superfamily ATPase